MIITLTTTDTTSRRTRHLSQDEITVLRLALKYFNENTLPLCSEEREQQYLNALKHLQDMVIESEQKESPVNNAQRHFITVHPVSSQHGPEFVNVEIKNK